MKSHFTCGECGEVLPSALTRHTFEDCRRRDATWVFVRYGDLRPSVRGEALRASVTERIDHETLVLVQKSSLGKVLQ